MVIPNPLSSKVVQALGLVFVVNLFLLTVFDRSWLARSSSNGRSLARSRIPTCLDCSGSSSRAPRPATAYLSSMEDASHSTKNLTLTEEFALSMGRRTADASTTTTEAPSLSSSPEKQLSLFKALMKERRETLERGCDELRHRRGGPYAAVTANYQNGVVMQSKDIVWCPVFKASSSTWLNYLLDIYPGMTDVRGLGEGEREEPACFIY